MTTQSQINNAAFWGQALCLSCGATETLEEEVFLVECDACGEEDLCDAGVLLRLQGMLPGEGEEE